MRPHPPRARPGSAPTALDRAPLASTSLASLAEQSPPSLRRLPVILQRLADVARVSHGWASTFGYLHQRLPGGLDIDLGVLADHHHPPLRKPARLNHFSGGAAPPPRAGRRTLASGSPGEGARRPPGPAPDSTRPPSIWDRRP